MLVAAIAAVTGCGGGGASGGGSGNGAGAFGAGSGSGSGAQSSAEGGAAQVQLLTSSSTVNSDGKTPIDLTAIVTSKQNVALADQPVTFSATDSVTPSGVRLEITQARTDATGRATARLVLSNNPTNRKVDVAAAVGSLAAAQLALNVTGTSIAASGPNALAFRSSTPSDYTFTLKDSSGTGLAGRTVAVTSARGNTVSPATATTDQSGQATVAVSGAVSGDDTLTFTGAGTSATLRIAVAGDNLSLVPPTSSTVAIGARAAFSVKFVRSAGIAPGTQVTFSSTRGVVSPQSADISGGTASFSVSSTFAGPATITASVGGVMSTAQISFVSVNPARIDLQPTPATIGPNVGTSTEQRSTLIAVVRDAAGNPVANQQVAFTAIEDQSGGRIEPGVALTDLGGQAQAAFIAGPNITASNGVRLQAQVVGASVISQQALLTVSRQELFARFETDERLEKVNEPPIYRRRYAVLVTDASGNGVADAIVQAKLKPLTYGTGFWLVEDTPDGKKWVQHITATYPSEDVNQNGVCDAAEDSNGDLNLTPGNVAAVTSNATTDSAGFATLIVSYPQGFANWASVLLEVTMRSAGSEGQSATRFTLPILASDLTDINVAPPGVNSPFPYTSGRTCPP